MSIDFVSATLMGSLTVMRCELVSEAKVELLLITLICEQLVIFIKGVMAWELGVLFILKLSSMGNVFVEACMLWCLNVSIVGVDCLKLLSLVHLAPFVFFLGLSVALILFSVALLLLQNVLTLFLAVSSLLFFVKALFLVLTRLLVAAANEITGVTLLTGKSMMVSAASAIIYWSSSRVLTVVLATVVILSQLLIDVLLIQNLVVEVRVDSPGMLVGAVHVAIHVSIMILVIMGVRAIGVGLVTVNGVVDGFMAIAVSMRVSGVGVTISVVVKVLIPVRVVTLVLHTLAHMASLSVVRTTSLVSVPVMMDWVT